MTPARRFVPVLTVGICLAAAGARAAEPPVPVPGVATVSQAEVVAPAAKDAPAPVVLDVRTPGEYAAGHVPGALNLPLDELAARLGELAPLKDGGEIVVYCQSGKRAARALETLGRAGFRHLAHLDGDMQGWLASGRPVATGAAPGR